MKVYKFRILFFISYFTIDAAEKILTPLAIDNPLPINDMLKSYLPDVLCNIVMEYAKYCPKATEKLLEALLENNLKEVKEAINEGADPNIKFEFFLDLNRSMTSWSTPLHYAVKLRNLEIMKVLVENGAKTNERNRYGSTPLHYACRKNLINLVKYLIDHGADVNDKEPNIGGYCPIHYAVLNYKNLPLVKYLIEEAHANLTTKNNLGLTALELAVEYTDNKEVINYLKEVYSSSK